MKKPLLVITLFVTQIIQSQTGRGNFLMNGSIGYSQSKNKTNSEYWPNPATEVKNTNLNGNIRLGYFFAKNFAAGVIVGDSYTRQYSYDENTDLKSYKSAAKTTINNVVSGGVFTRGYKVFNNGKFAFIGELYGIYGFGNSKYTSTVLVGTTSLTSEGSTGTVQSINVGLRPGFTYFLTNKIGLEVFVGSLSFNSTKQKDQGNTATTSGLNFNLNASTISLGVSFYLGGKQ